MAILRLGTANLLHGMALSDQRCDPALLGDAARTLDADLVGLQEVDCCQERSGGVDQAAVWAEAMGAEHVRFVAAVHGTPGSDGGWRPADGDAHGGEGCDGPTYGVALASRLPVERWRVLRFPAAPARLPLLVPGQPRPRIMWIPDEPRLAIAAVVRGPAGPLTVVTAHLSFVPGYNARQLRQIVRWARDLPRPLVVLGDFNLPGALPARLTRLTSLVAAPTYPSWKPRVQFDHVLADGIDRAQVRRVVVRALAVSDHCGVTVDVEV